MKFIHYNGEDVCLILAQPMMRPKPKLTLILPFTDTDTAISHREERKTMGKTGRYVFEYTPHFKNAGFSTEFRIGLQRLHDEVVAVPLWMDWVKLSGPAAKNDTILFKTADMPVRYGAEWLIVTPEPTSWNGWTYEIVTVTGITSNTITVSTPLAGDWPAGTFLYPLMFGRLEERPKLQTLKPRVAEGALKFREDSTFARRINVIAGSIPTVGTHVDEFKFTPLWNIEPTYEQVLDTTEVDILFEQLGFLRQEQRYTYVNSVRRGLEMGFVCRNRDMISRVERIFMDRRGPTKAFMVPTFRNDLIIANDLPRSGFSSIIDIESSEYSDATRPVQPSDPYLALIDLVSDPSRNVAAIDPQRVSIVAGTQLTVAVPITTVHKKGYARLSHLLLCCFGAAEITWEYTTPLNARTRIRFLEKPEEYVNPQTGVTEPAYLYKFTKQYPTPIVQYFTSYEDSISYGGNSYTPAPFDHGEIESGITFEKEEVKIMSWTGNFPGNPLQALFPYTLEGQLEVEIIEVNVASPNDSFARTLFSGVVGKVEVKGKHWQVTAAYLGKFLERNVPRFFYQKTSNVAIFSPKSGLVKNDWKVTGTFHGAPGTNTVVVIDGGTDKPANYFAGGFCETGTGSNFERRPILKSEVVSGRLNITIDRRFRNAASSQSIDMWPGCNDSIESYIALFNDVTNFRGHPYKPPKNPSANVGEVTHSTGGKKG